MQRKMLSKIKLSLILFFLIFVFNAYGEVPGRLPSNIPPKETLPSKITPASSLTQKASDLSIERIYLKDCRIHVLIKNIGSAGVSDEDYQSGELLVLVKKGEKDFEKNSFKLKDVDPKFILKTPGQQVEFDTKISLQDSQSVRAQLEKFKNDGNKGKKYLSTELVISSICKNLITSKQDIKATDLPLKTNVMKERAHLFIENVSSSKDCEICLTIKNKGLGGLSEEEYRNARLVLFLKDEKGQIIGSYNFSIRDMDPKGQLKSSKSEVSFNTKIKCTQRANIILQFENLKTSTAEKKHMIFIPPEMCLKERFTRAIPLVKEPTKGISKFQEMYLEEPIKTKKQVLSITKGPDDLEGITISPLSPRKMEPPPPPSQSNEVPALTLFGTIKDKLIKDIEIDGLYSFNVVWDLNQLRMHEVRVGNVPIKVVSGVDFRVIYLGDQNVKIFENSWKGYPDSYIFLEKDLIEWLKKKNLFRWDKLEYKFRLEGEVTYRINPLPRGNLPPGFGNIPESQNQSSEIKYPLNSILLICSVRVDPNQRYSNSGVLLAPSITVESSRILREVTPSGVSVPSEREVKLKARVKNEGTRSTAESITNIGREAYSQSPQMRRGSFWVTVYRCYAGPRGCLQIAQFLVDPLDPGHEWVSQDILDISPAEETVYYRAYADTLNFIGEEVEGFYTAVTSSFERYWDTRSDVNISINRIRVEPDTITAGGNATVYVELQNQSRENVPVIFLVEQPSSISFCEARGYLPETLPVSLNPGTNTVRLSILNFNPPYGNLVALRVTAYKAYASKVYNAYVGYGIWDTEIMGATEISSGQYRFTQVPPTFKITTPIAGRHYKSKYPPFSIFWSAYDPSGQIGGNVELFYRIKQNNQWTNWQSIASVPVTSGSYTWRPEFTSSGEVETQIRAVWSKPQQDGSVLTDETGVFYTEFQSNYNAYGIEIINPTSSTIWESGRSYTIRWRVDPQRYTRISSIILHQVDSSGRPSGGSWRLAENIPIRQNEGSINVQVPNISNTRGEFQVRIELILEWDYEQSARSGEFIPRVSEIRSEIFRVRQN